MTEPDDTNDAEPESPGAPSELRAQMHARRVELERQFEATRAQFDATQERIQARTGRNLLLAIVIGLVLGGGLLVSLLIVKQLFMVFAAVLIGFTTAELATALRRAGYGVPRIPTVVGGVAVVPLAYYGGPAGQLVGVLGAILLVAAWRLVEQLIPSRRDTALLPDLSAAVFVQAYVTFLASFTVVLTAQDGGQWWALGFIVIVVLADTGAYAAGLTLGKHPMAPVISPKKTWEGFAGGALTCLIAGVLVGIFMLGTSWWFGLLFGAAIFLSATLGDLAESLIKRDIGIKDMSSKLPGHGGFLDRLDSILPSAAVAFTAFLLFTAA
ncbi:phosphatidate cytidylyltransferase [Agromyces sp. SYSU T00194]|uniref:phosphatidate cytidylyltransferase n=1 Tax=Agromyces chitinivorans TaxID=3158560 RepID=UPI003398A515